MPSFLFCPKVSQLGMQPRKTKKGKRRGGAAKPYSLRKMSRGRRKSLKNPQKQKRNRLTRGTTFAIVIDAPPFEAV